MRGLCRGVGELAVSHLGLGVLLCALAGLACNGTMGLLPADGGGGGDGDSGPGDSGPDGGGGGGGYGDVDSHIWIANSMEGTVSKLDTVTGTELARYYTGPEEGQSDPSRTSVNLHGDAAVTNRDPYSVDGYSSASSSVTKFAAALEDCVDRNGNGTIETSHGPGEVLPWGQDECMLWNTPLESGSEPPRDDWGMSSLGARATAWDGTEDPETGAGGSVWVGAFYTGEIFQLDGDTGEVIARTVWSWEDGNPWGEPGGFGGGHGTYGGAMDGRGNFWVFDGGMHLGRVNTSTLEIDTFEVPCGYGIAVDSQDRVWTSGSACVNRFDPDTGENVTLEVEECMGGREGEGGMWGEWCFFRGLAVDGQGSVWVAETSGAVMRVDEEEVTLVHRAPLGGARGIVGVAVDYHGQVWAVAQESDAALKIDPETYEVERFQVGSGPYTYSDMTGFQLRTVVLY